MREKERESVGFFMFVLVMGFYNAKKNANIVLTKHFDLIFNDDCLASGRVIITVLGVWQVL